MCQARGLWVPAFACAFVVSAAAAFDDAARLRGAVAPPAAVGAWQGASAQADSGAKIWLGRHQEFEDFIRTAKPSGKMERLPVGVTAPKKVTFEPGGLVPAVAWKVIQPGLAGGYYESYKSEIAAYELDKALGLGMIPPTVERQISGDRGAAVMWVSGTKSFKDLGGVPKPPPAMIAKWNRQLTRAKLFDNLIGNKDPNLGNWLVDDQWNVILIDHSRCFTSDKSLYHKMTSVERELWDRIAALDEASLTATIGKWVGRGEIRAMLARRDKMVQAVAKLPEVR